MSAGDERAHPPRPRRVGRYVLYDEIGSGGTATVHLGRLRGPAGFAPLVAVKTLRSPFEGEPKFLAMLKDEARLAASVRHPNVATVIDVLEGGDERAELFLVMEYVHGASLRRLADEHQGPVPPPVAAAIVAGVLAGLHAAHEARGSDGAPLDVVHRDVTPHNVLVGVDGVPRVVDFGIAKAHGRMQATTQVGEVKGKLGYMAPEQLLDEKPLTRQVDVWAAGVVLWELLAGRRLFAGAPGATPDDVVQEILFGEIAPPSRHVPDVPPALDAVVLRALSREKTARFATAREMELALERSLTVASAPAVAEWVTGCAADALADRQLLLDAIGRAPAEEPGPERDAAASAPVRRWRGPVLAATAALVGLLALVVRSRLAPVASASPGASVSSPSSSVAAGAGAPPDSSMASSTSSVVVSDPASALPPREPAPIPARRAAAPPRTPRVDCDPPYTLNARNEKVYKRECFGLGR